MTLISLKRQLILFNDKRKVGIIIYEEFEDLENWILYINSEDIKEGVLTLPADKEGICATLDDDIKAQIVEIIVPPNFKIGESVFSACPNLIKVTLSENVSTDESAFEGCDNLQTLNLSEGVKLGDTSFAHSKNLESVVLSTNTTLGWAVFASCEKLKALFISPRIDFETETFQLFKLEVNLGEIFKNSDNIEMVFICTSEDDEYKKIYELLTSELKEKVSIVCIQKLLSVIPIMLLLVAHSFLKNKIQL